MQQLALATPTNAGAIFSPDRKKRFLLWRPTGLVTSTRVLTSFMLNPSDADENDNDPTVRRLLGFGRSWGCGRLRVVNMYPHVTSSPKVLKTLTDLDTLDLENWNHVVTACEGADIILCAWGANARPNVAEVCRQSLTRLGFQLHVLGFTKEGQPKHPVRLSSKLQPQLWTP